MVAPVEDGNFLVGHALAVHQVEDFGGDAGGLVVAIVHAQDADAFAFAQRAAQGFVVKMGVVGDQCIRGVEDRTGRAVVHLELDDLERRVVFAEFAQVLGARATPGVDRLVVVTHHGEGAARAGQCLEEAVLGGVAVLVFVDQQVAQAVLPALGHLRILLQHPHRAGDEIVEVDATGGFELALVAGVGSGIGLARHGFRRKQRRLPLRYFPLGRADHLVAVAVAGGHLSGYEDARRLRVEDGEAALEAGHAVLFTQQPQAETVKRADMHLVGALTQQSLAPGAHFACRLLRESHRGNVFGPIADGPDEVRDFLGYDTGLAAARAGEHQQRSTAVFHGGALLRVQPGVLVRLAAHAGILRSLSRGVSLHFGESRGWTGRIGVPPNAGRTLCFRLYHWRSEMKRTSGLILVTLLAIPAMALGATYKIDSAHTYPQFDIRHLQFSMLHGQFNHTTGTITMNRAKHIGSVKVTISVKSIDTGDAQRNKDLLAPAFFDAAHYPTITYKSTKVTYHGKDAATVQGNLTIKGHTRPVTLKVTRIHCAADPFSKGTRCGFDAETEINRTRFGVSGDPGFIPNSVYLVINADAVAPPKK